MSLADLLFATRKEGKYCVVKSLNVDVSTFGDTKKQALKNLQEALGLYLEGDFAVLVKVGRTEVVSLASAYA